MKLSQIYIVFFVLFLTSICNIALADDENWVEMKLVEPGQLIRVKFGDELFGVLYRSKDMLHTLSEKYNKVNNIHNGIDSTYRSIKEKYLVFNAKSQKSMCIINYTEDGLIDDCTGEKYDYSGRSISGDKLKIPIHKYISQTKIVFGNNQ